MGADANGKVWKHLSEVMRGRWDASRHEDTITAGVPDVSYACRGADGWIELKYAADWPARPETPFRAAGFTTEQLRFLQKRGAEGSGRCFVLIRVRTEYLLFRWDVAHLLTAGATRSMLAAAATGAWMNWIDTEELVKILSQ